MTVWVVAIVALAASVAVAAIAITRRRAVARERQRVTALTALAERIDAAVAPLRRPPPALPEPRARGSDLTAPLVADRLPGRAALIDAAAAAVADARAGGWRLSAALVTVAGDTTPAALADTVRSLAGAPVYAVGPSSVAVTLPGVGRADALGLLARIEAEVSSTGRAVELGPDEDAVEFVTRLLDA